MIDIDTWIKNQEGLKLTIYKDIVDKWTVGYGRNIQDRGISTDEAELMFQNDKKLCIKQLNQYSWYLVAPQHTQFALINMCFNMGINRLLGFKKMVRALIEKNYTQAAIEALDSKWAQQVGQRAKDVALMMRQGF